MKRAAETHKVLNPAKKQKPTLNRTKSQLFIAKNKTGPEKKNIDITATIGVASGSATFGAVQDLNVVAQGTTAETRLGRKIIMTSMELRWSYSLAPTSIQGSPLRVLVVYDKQANAAAAAATDILQTPAVFTTCMNLANSERFVVIMSFLTEPISLNNNYSVAGVQYRRFRLETVFNDTNAGTIADIQTGAILLLTCQDGNIGTANASFLYYSRIRFEDE